MSDFDLPTLVIYLSVSFSGLITSTSVGEERAKFLLSLTRDYVVSVRRGFLFLLVLRIGCVILLWHSLYVLLISVLKFKYILKILHCVTRFMTV